MYFSMVCFSFPVRTLMIVVFAQRSGRNYKILSINTVLDIALFMGVLVWYGRYEYLSSLEGYHEIGIDDRNVYIVHIINDI